jgi:glutaconate CoA-transferase subunit B
MSDVFTKREMMAVAAARLVRDGDILFAGTGLSVLAAALARRLKANSSVVFFETGGIDPSMDELPLSVADPRVMTGTSVNCSLVDAFCFLGNPKLTTVAFLGAAQVDPYGNLNSTSIGDYKKPKIRLPGSGGACDAATLASRVIIFMKHEKRRFVQKLDYLTSPGWLSGDKSREQAGFKRGGPLAVVTDLAVLKFDDQTRRMYLDQHFPEVTPEIIVESTGFDLDVSRATPAPPPTAEELQILREQVDPQHLILG